MAIEGFCADLIVLMQSVVEVVAVIAVVGGGGINDIQYHLYNQGRGQVSQFDKCGGRRGGGGGGGRGEGGGEEEEEGGGGGWGGGGKVRLVAFFPIIR